MKCRVTYQKQEQRASEHRTSNDTAIAENYLETAYPLLDAAEM